MNNDRKEELILHEGEFIYIRNRKESKLQPKWLGTFEVKKRKQKGAYELFGPNNSTITVNQADLLPVYHSKDLERRSVAEQHVN